MTLPAPPALRLGRRALSCWPPPRAFPPGRRIRLRRFGLPLLLSSCLQAGRSEVNVVLCRLLRLFLERMEDEEPVYRRCRQITRSAPDASRIHISHTSYLTVLFGFQSIGGADAGRGVAGTSVCGSATTAATIELALGAVPDELRAKAARLWDVRNELPPTAGLVAPALV